MVLITTEKLQRIFGFPCFVQYLFVTDNFCSIWSIFVLKLELNDTLTSVNTTMSCLAKSHLKLLEIFRVNCLLNICRNLNKCEKISGLKIISIILSMFPFKVRKVVRHHSSMLSVVGLLLYFSSSCVLTIESIKFMQRSEIKTHINIHKQCLSLMLSLH